MSPSGRSWSDGRARRWPVILAWLLAVVAVVALVVVLIGGGSTTTVVRTVIVRTGTGTGTGTGSASVTEDTLQGAVLAAATVNSRDLMDQWSTTLGYRVVSFTPSTATVETIQRVRPRVKGRHTIWLGWNIHVAYQGGEWTKIGQLDPGADGSTWNSPPSALLGELKPWPAA